MRRLIALEARVYHPVGAHREVLETAKAEAVGVLQIAHAYAEVADALDDEEAQRAALEHGRLAARIGGELEGRDRCTIVRDAAPGAGDEAHLRAAAHEGSGGVGESCVVEDQRVARRAPKGVLAFLQPE